MDEQRRALLQAAAASGLLGSVSAEAGAATDSNAPLLDAIPPLPQRPSPGRPGDFDFLAGQWRIQNWRLPPGATQWDRFEGEARCWTILDGAGSVEELRIPARQFSGMGLRLLERETERWGDFWVSGRSGVLTTPGLQGSFEQGVGLFWAEDGDANVAGQREIALGVWDRIDARSCRWRQAVSSDGGRSWAQNWVMHWQRV
ncbi:hypothetical protein RQP53_02275 [Paucibacter sp. APW11]|uniref:Lipocalin-like domain-containing protein n=1 Tax=Roseateles aquae TaxID=3077235 RepID=A0ABU3P6A0_9BURK|nr:hypothetical protein [Paucibacter sp. APW11]MDT8998095.1 hypothetical protein [Paucibacter sp. APW11]